MDERAILRAMEDVLEDSHTGVLTTVGVDGSPRSRWMTPAVIRGREGFLYAVTVPSFRKAVQIGENPNVEWMVQTRSLSEIINVRGTARLIDNPVLKADVLEGIGGHMTVFWRVNADEEDYVVIETRIEEIEYFQPTKGVRNSASLRV